MSDPAPAMPPPAKVKPARGPGSNSNALQVGVVVIAGLYFGREVLVPITLAVLLAFLLAPLVGWLRRAHLPRAVAVLLSVLAAIAVAVGIGGLIGTQVASLATEAPHYASTIESKVQSIQGFATAQLSSITRLGNRRAGPAAPAGIPGPTPAVPATPAPLGAPAPVAPTAQPAPSDSSILGLAERILAPILSPLSTAAIVFIFAVFILLQQEDLRDRLIRLFGSGDLHRTTVALDDAGSRLSRYFLAQLGVNAGVGCVIALGTFVIGIPSPLLWGVLATLLRFVPYIGPILAACLPMALGAAIAPGWSTVVWTGALFLVTEGVTGQVIEPMLYGRSTGLSPVAVVVAATFWTWLWGPIGLILSTPLTLCLVVMGRHVPQLEFLDVMLGDRPALTPVESFYQRMLADDPDEAQDQAELLLKERSLSSYYDEVALKGLQLAANDLRRGVLDTNQLERIKEAIKTLVDELDVHDDREPGQDAKSGAKAEAKAKAEMKLSPSLAEQGVPSEVPPDHAPDPDALPAAWTAETAVLCLAGRGPLDEAASVILAQLLRKHGLGAHVVPHEAASRGQIGRLDTAGVAMVCISYLEISGNPSHLRFLVGRVRQRLPGRPILVGLWPAEDAILKDRSLQSTLGAAYYTSSLHQAVQACVEAARAAQATQAAAPEAVPQTA